MVSVCLFWLVVFWYDDGWRFRGITVTSLVGVVEGKDVLYLQINMTCKMNFHFNVDISSERIKIYKILG
jgi:hypothetical protein